MSDVLIDKLVPVVLHELQNDVHAYASLWRVIYLLVEALDNRGVEPPKADVEPEVLYEAMCSEGMPDAERGLTYYIAKIVCAEREKVRATLDA